MSDAFPELFGNINSPTNVVIKLNIKFAQTARIMHKITFTADGRVSRAKPLKPSRLIKQQIIAGMKIGIICVR